MKRIYPKIGNSLVPKFGSGLCEISENTYYNWIYSTKGIFIRSYTQRSSSRDHAKLKIVAEDKTTIKKPNIINRINNWK